MPYRFHFLFLLFFLLLLFLLYLLVFLCQQRLLFVPFLLSLCQRVLALFDPVLPLFRLLLQLLQLLHHAAVVDNGRPQEEQEQYAHCAHNRHYHHVVVLVEVSQCHSGYQVTEHLRPHVERPEIGEEESFSAFGGAIGYEFATCGLSNSFPESVEERRDHGECAHESVGEEEVCAGRVVVCDGRHDEGDDEGHGQQRTVGHRLDIAYALHEIHTVHAAYALAHICH